MKKVVGGATKLFQVQKGQGHTSQADWSPELVPSLFIDLSKQYNLDEGGNITDEPKEWAENVRYAFGDKCIGRDGKVYESKIEGNTQVPTKDEPHNRYWKEI